MLRRKVLVVAALLALAPYAPARAAQDNAALAPSSSWHLDYGDVRCRLARSFGEGEDRVLLAFDQFSPGDTFMLTLAGTKVGRIVDSRAHTIQFGPLNPDKRESSPQQGQIAEFGACPHLLATQAPG